MDVDLHDALADVEGSARQWAQAAALPVPHVELSDLDAVVVAGVGGSGIAGDLAVAVAEPRLHVPVLVHRDEGLPAFVGPRTLVVAVSHSGDSRETLAAADEARLRGARLLAVTSGGTLADRMAADGLPLVVVPGGRPPRHSLASLVVPVLRVLGLDGVDEAVGILEDLAGRWSRSVPEARNEAKQLARRLASGPIPVVYGSKGLAAVAAYRLKCQLNENAKLPAFWNVLPELCHNELVGWQHVAGPAASNPSSAWGLVCFRDAAGETDLTQRRTELALGLIADRFTWRATLAAHGEGPVARLASMILLGDLASVYAALLLRRDPTPIELITRLKKELGG